MKKKLLYLLCVMASLMMPMNASAELQGSGTEKDPYLIYTLDDLKAFRDSCNAFPTFRCEISATLMADIDMKNENWGPICGLGTNMYMGVFDGNFHKISHLKSDAYAQGVSPDHGFFAGLFGWTEGFGRIKNFLVEDIDLNGFWAGVVAAVGYQCHIQNVGVIGDIKIASYGYEGALCAWGYNEAAIENCFTTHSCLTNMFGGTVKDCYYLNTSELGYGTPWPADRFSSGELCYALNNYTPVGVWRQTLGTADFPTFTGKKVYYDEKTKTYNNTGVGAGTEEDPFLLYDFEDLKNFRDLCNAYNDWKVLYCARLEADIDMENENWKPICGADATLQRQYAGHFDGNGHTIKNLKSDNSDSSIGAIAGLFGYTEGWAKIHDLFIENASCHSDQAAAVAARLGYQGTIEHVAVIGNVDITTPSGADRGAMCGWAYSESKLNSNYTTFELISTGAEGKVTDCYYISETKQGKGDKMAAEDLASGAMCYAVNGHLNEGYWKQTLGKDAYPNFTGLDIYYSAKTGLYSNSNLGSGTEDDPFLINKLTELEAFRDLCNNYHEWKVPYYARLEADIDLGGQYWKPICICYGETQHVFAGGFDGNKHKIKNLVCNSDSVPAYGDVLGLFGWTEGEGTITDLVLENVDVYSTNNAGGVVGRLGYKSSLENVSVVGNVNVRTSSGDWCGPLVAWSYQESYIGNSFTTADFISMRTEGEVYNSYYMNTEEKGVAGEPMTEAQFKSGELAYTLNEEIDEGIWKQTLKVDNYPNFTGKPIYFIEGEYCNSKKGSGTKEDPFKISTLQDLKDFRDLCNVYENWAVPYCAVLKEDIDMENENWVPICIVLGNDAHQYIGTFDGNGHKLMNLTSDGDTDSEHGNIRGLFGYTEGWGNIKNLIIENVTLVGAQVGAVVARNGYQCCLENIGVIGNISVNATSVEKGAIVGCGYVESTVKNSYTTYSLLTNAFDGPVTNCFYVGETTAGKGTMVSAEQLASGEVCYKMNGENPDGVWRQTLGTDVTPNFSGLKVYYDGSKYTNDETGINDIQLNENDYTVYSVNGMKQAGLQKGINIVKMSNGSVKKVFK